MKTFILSIITTLIASPVFSAVSERSDDGMTLVYLFLGLCGLIIFLQLIPVFALGFGIVKSVFTKNEKVI